MENDKAKSPGNERRAEGRIRERIADLGKLSPEEVARLVEELEVHRAELATQNAELQANQQLLEQSRSRYADLYDFARFSELAARRGARGASQVRTAAVETTLAGRTGLVPAGRAHAFATSAAFGPAARWCHATAVDTTLAARTGRAFTAGPPIGAVGRRAATGTEDDAGFAAVAAYLVLIAVVNDDLQPVGMPSLEDHAPAHLGAPALVLDSRGNRIVEDEVPVVFGRVCIGGRRDLRR